MATVARHSPDLLPLQTPEPPPLRTQRVVVGISSLTHAPIIFENTPEPLSTPGMTRRSLLKAGVLAAGLETGVLAAKAEWEDSTFSMALAKPDISKIPIALPPELANKPLQYENSRFRPNVAEVVRDGIESYERRGGRPYYRKPDFYMSQWDMWNAFRRAYKHHQAELDVAGRPYEKVMNFSSANFRKGAVYIYRMFDPGSSSRQLAEQQLVAAYRANPALNEETEKSIVSNAYGTVFFGAKDHIDALRQGGQVSTSELFAYFLGQSQGDITTSLIDTTLFLKLAARCPLTGLLNRQRFNVGHKSNHSNAKLISDMFYDDFSVALPLDTVVANVDPSSELNDYKGDYPFKDYDPVNRAGTPYHIWNLLMMAACGDPVVPQKMTLGYYTELHGLRIPDHGRIKVATDFHAVAQSRAVREVIDQYAV